MSNAFISTQEIARALLPRLRDNLVFPNLVRRDFSNDIVEGKGATVLAELPYYFEAKDFTDGNNITIQDIKQKSVPVTLDKFKTVDVNWSSFEGAVNITDSKIQKILDGMAAALAEAINADGCALYKDVPYVTGTPGTTPDSLEDFANARKVLNANKAPMDSRRAVWDVDADAKLTQIGNLTKVSEAGSPDALREGEIGRVYGLDNYMTQGIKNHTQGTAISGNKTIAVAAAASAGATTISVDSGSSAGTLKAGDVIKIGNYAYTVAEDVASIGTTAADVKLVQALKADVADNAAITFPTYVSGKTGYAANLAFQESAFAFVTRPLATPSSADSYTVSYNGLSIRVTRAYNINTKRETLSADIIYGYKTCIPELACVICG